mmetsp:Transcript_56359/g.149770  ORF Transcript_56359/g.149770 Transcript_56359/m.149770 type:complete len:271 (+) Transcript_56359:627-1439(+)
MKTRYEYVWKLRGEGKGRSLASQTVARVTRALCAAGDRPHRRWPPCQLRVWHTCQHPYSTQGRRTRRTAWPRAVCAAAAGVLFGARSLGSLWSARVAHAFAVYSSALATRSVPQVVHPDEPRRDVVLHLERALAQHEHAVRARAERDADDVVRHERADEAHEALSRKERAEQRGEEEAKAMEPSERHDARRREQRDHDQPGQRAHHVGEHPRPDGVRAVHALPRERRPLHHEEGQHGDRHKDEEGCGARGAAALALGKRRAHNKGAAIGR